MVRISVPAPRRGDVVYILSQRIAAFAHGNKPGIRSEGMTALPIGLAASSMGCLLGWAVDEIEQARIAGIAARAFQRTSG